jgi:hypothetical protein
MKLISCYNRETRNPVTGTTMGQLQVAYEDRKLKLVRAGYEYVEIWEHEFDEMMKTTPVLGEMAAELKVYIYFY